MAPPPAPTALIALDGLSKSYNIGLPSETEVLHSLTLRVDRGEFVALMGPSGSGKSTLLNILGLLEPMTSGSYHLMGEEMRGLDDMGLTLRRRRILGFVFQFHHLLPEFTALENAMMPGLIKGLSKSVSRDLAEKILVRVGLKSRLQQQVTKLSGGEQQRVALARALVLKPALLLADEPTGNLDQKNSEQVHELLLELNRELNMTMVVVTHNMKLASYMARRVTIMDGKLVEAN